MKLYKYVSESRYEPVMEIPDNPTNGEVLTKMFPKAMVTDIPYRVVVKLMDNGFNLTFDVSWWNAKWGE